MDDRIEKSDAAPQAVGHALKSVRFVVGAILLGCLALNLANVVGRYVIHEPIIAAEELLRFGMVWCIFLGAVLVTWEGQHLRMDIIFIVLPSPVKRVLNAFVLVTFVVIGSIVVVTSGQIVELVRRFGEVSVVAEIPMAIPWAAIPISFALMVVFVLLRARTILSGRLDDAARLGEFAVEEECRVDADRS